jgi:hypothetical protein
MILILVCPCSRDQLITGNSWSCVPCYLAVQKTLIVGMPGREIYRVLFSERSDGSFTETRHHRRRQPTYWRWIHPVQNHLLWEIGVHRCPLQYPMSFS